MPHPLLRLIPLFAPHMRLLVISTTGLFIASILALAGPALVARAIDVDIPNDDLLGLQRTALAYVITLFGSLVATYLSRVAIEIVAQRAMKALKEQLFAHLVHHDVALHDQHSSGHLITRVQSDTEALRLLFTEVILTAPSDAALLLGMLAVLAWYAPTLIAPLLTIVPAWVLIFGVYRRFAPPFFLAARTVRSALTGALTELIRALPTLHSYGRLDWARARAQAANADVRRRDVGMHVVSNAYFNALFLVRSLGLVAVIWWGALAVASDAITTGALVMGLGYVRQLFNPLMRLSQNMAALERARSASIRIGELLDRAPTIAAPTSATAWPGLTDGVRFEGVGFAYPDGPPVLHAVDWFVPAGATVGIVGATGSGKSTLLNLLLRFRDPTRGRVTIDGVDLRALSIADLRAHVGLVLQDVHLFPGTVLENLGGETISAQRALDTLGVQLPLDRVLAAGGNDLSRGERQLLTFARAIVRDPTLLVLDEATSAVDPATEARVQAALDRIQAGRTTVIVAHRLATVRDCDAIIVLVGGRIVEAGTHDSLLDADGVYAALHQLQAAA